MVNAAVRKQAVASLQRVLSSKCSIPDSEKYSSAIEASLFASHRDSKLHYVEQLKGIALNLPNIIDEIPERWSPERIAQTNPIDLRNAQQQKQWEREHRKRTRELQIRPEDSSMCPTCHLPLRSRINENLFDKDDEHLGCQYENNFDQFCQCPPANDASQDSDESSSSDGDDGLAREQHLKATKKAQD